VSALYRRICWPKDEGDFLAVTVLSESYSAILYAIPGFRTPEHDEALAIVHHAAMRLIDPEWMSEKESPSSIDPRGVHV